MVQITYDDTFIPANFPNSSNVGGCERVARHSRNFFLKRGMERNRKRITNKDVETLA